MTHPALRASLTLREATEVTDPETAARLAGSEDDDTTDFVAGYISEQGRVLAWRTTAGEHVLYESAISVGGDDYEWTSVGTPRIYLFNTDDTTAIHQDTLRLFLSQSLGNNAARRSAGWRDRIVALVPEEVGAKECKVIRTLADGTVEATHTYNVLDAYAKYADWVNTLAEEFGSTDEKLETGVQTPGMTPLPYIAASIAQAWLMREAADAQLDQARHSLKVGLAGFSRLLSMTETESGASVAELARSLHTDRPNLARAIKSAECDPRVKATIEAIDRMAR